MQAAGTEPRPHTRSGDTGLCSRLGLELPVGFMGLPFPWEGLGPCNPLWPNVLQEQATRGGRRMQGPEAGRWAARAQMLPGLPTSCVDLNKSTSLPLHFPQNISSYHLLCKTEQEPRVHQTPGD